MMSNIVRPAAVAGTFYPADPPALRRLLATLLADARCAPPTQQRSLKALIVPHAGYRYSGPVAARAYADLQGWRDRIRRVVLLGPVHRVPVRGVAVPSARVFATPLGDVPVDEQAIARLADLPQVVVSAAAHAWEHALEVQLPFLQAVLPRFTCVPLAVGQASAAEVAQVIERLWGGPETLIVVSSDLSHYHTDEQARRLDAESLQHILALDPVLDHAQACGATPINGLLLAARRHGLVPELLDYRNSGDTAGDRSRVVGYAALRFAEADDGVTVH